MEGSYQFGVCALSGQTSPGRASRMRGLEVCGDAINHHQKRRNATSDNSKTCIVFACCVFLDGLIRFPGGKATFRNQLV